MTRTSLLLLAAGLLTAPLLDAVGQDITVMEQHMVKIAGDARQAVVCVSARRGWPEPDGKAIFSTSHSGVVWDADGHILTAAEAVFGAKAVTVETVNGREFEATVVGADDQTNTAIIKADPKGLRPLAQGTSADLRIGHWVLAIGNPFGFSGSVSLGIVSGVDRRIEWDGRPIWGMIQITAPINPGDTGGAVVNSRGQLVGIIHSTFGRAPSIESLHIGPDAFGRGAVTSALAAESINFVMPVDTVKPIAAQLIRHGEVRRGWLGVGVETITRRTPEADRQGREKGVVVVRVLADSPAEAAGILPDDVLTDYHGKAIEGGGQLIQMVGNTAPNEKVTIQGVRGGKPTPFTVTIGKAPQAKTSYRRMIGDLVPFFTKGWLGVHVENVTAEHADALKIEHGALVVSVLPGSPAQEMGVLIGDVIVKLNNQEVRDALGLRSAVLSRGPDEISEGVFKLEIVRKGERLSVSSRQ